MLKGDLASSPLPVLLRQLADGGSTGCVHVIDDDGEQASVFLRGGRVYAVVLADRRPTLGARLVTSGALGPEALAEACEAQRTELQGWQLGELLVHLGYVDQPVVEAFVQEQVREALSDLLRWDTGSWRFRLNERTRADVAPPVDVEDLLREVDRRRADWDAITGVVHGADGVPVLSAAGDGSDEMVVDGDAWSMLCKVDGQRTVADLARACGLTLFEGGHVVHTLVLAGLLEVDPPAGDEPGHPPVESFVPAAVASRLAGALRARPDDVRPDDAERALDGAEPARRLTLPDADEVEGSLSRVSQALSSLLGPSTASDDIFDAPRRHAHPTPPPAGLGTEDPKRAERARLEGLRRERDAEELAAAQAELESAKAAEQDRFEALHDDSHVADVVDLQTRRDEAAEAEAARAAEREAAREVAREVARLADEETAREAEEETARLAAEHAERRAEEEAAREAEQQRLADEEAARVAHAEAARLAEEKAAREAEQQRLADEEAARVAHAEAARLAEEKAAREAEQQRLADEEAARVAHAEAARLAEEKAARQAEQQRLADEEAAHAQEQRRLEQQDADRAADEARRALDAPLDPAAHAAVFAELSAAAHAFDIQTQPEPAAGAVLTREPDPVTEPDEPPLPVYVERDTDTAALLRELSSLGLDDDPPPPPTTRPVPSTPRPTPTQQQRKRKGLFGRN